MENLSEAFVTLSGSDVVESEGDVAESGSYVV